jgi:hypothetical protein
VKSPAGNDTDLPLQALLRHLCLSSEEASAHATPLSLSSVEASAHATPLSLSSVEERVGERRRALMRLEWPFSLEGEHGVATRRSPRAA